MFESRYFTSESRFHITGATGIEIKIKATASPDFLTIGTSKTIKQTTDEKG
ncbi:hypothetical protein SDC9_117012 [bioreactor metagenome]|uniref:Uncharacterized protein n=1 Tax=bioreactor metagenome TaxID=1076179 RepID=A0A645BZE8_9ZZZZ